MSRTIIKELIDFIEAQDNVLINDVIRHIWVTLRKAYDVIKCPECGAGGLHIDLDNNQASCEYCGCYWLELDMEEWYNSSEESVKE